MRRSDELGLSAMRRRRWKLEAERAELEKIGRTISSTPPRRQAAIGALVDLGGPQTVKHLETLAQAPQTYAARVDAIAGLAAIDTKQAADLAAECFSANRCLPAAIHRRRSRRSSAAPVGRTCWPPPSNRRSLRPTPQRSAPANSMPPVSPRPLWPRRSAPATRRRIAKAVLPRRAAAPRAPGATQGDPHRGEKIFRGSVGCMQCHSIAGAGGNVAPDLATIGTTAQPDFLVEHLIIPNKSIKDGYVALEVITKDGDSFTGIRQRETATDLVLRDATHDEIIIPKSTIKRQRPIGTLMPSGLTDGLTDNELADLVRFLSEFGKPGPFDVGHAPVSRQWLTLAAPSAEPVPARLQHLGPRSLTDAHLTWTRAYSDVRRRCSPVGTAIGPNAATVILRSRMNVTASGKCGLSLNSDQGVRLWLDGHPMSPASSPASTSPLAFTRSISDRSVIPQVVADLALRTG